MRYEEKLLILITNYRLGSWLLVQKSVVCYQLSVVWNFNLTIIILVLFSWLVIRWLDG